MLTDENKDSLRTLIQSKVDESVPKSSDSPTRDADLQCSGCGTFVTFDGVEIKSADFTLVCRSCAKEASAPRRIPVKLLKNPMFYVAAITVWAIALWALGWGNNSVSATQRSDVHREWYEKRYAGNLVLQVMRTKTRGEYLATKGSTKEAAIWFGLARDSAIKAADDWAGKPAEPVMRFMAAMFAMQAGDAQMAYAEILLLTDALDTGDESQSFRYHRGLCALKVGNIDAAKKDLDHLLTVADDGALGMDKVFGKNIDRMIERAEKGADPKRNLMLRLKQLAQLDMPRSDMVHGVAEAYLKHKVDHPELDYWKRKLGLDDPEVVATDGKRGGVGFEDVEEDE
jgi:hypothetical protein